MSTKKIAYQFMLPNGNLETFRIELDADRVLLVNPQPSPPPKWVALDFHQCPHCPLTIEAYPSCPLALNLASTVARLDKMVSHTEITVRVVTEERMIYTRTTVQRGISSMMGLLIAASECPHTHLFKPMARFHLPFATDTETIWRAASTYLLAQFFRSRKDLPFDMQMTEFQNVYENIQVVNMHVAKRLRAVIQKDSTVNALIILDVYAKTLPPAIEEAFAEIAPMFEAYLQEPVN